LQRLISRQLDDYALARPTTGIVPACLRHKFSKDLQSIVLFTLEAAFQPKRHREDSAGYTETAAQLPGEQPIRDKRLYRQDSLRRRVSVVKDYGVHFRSDRPPARDRRQRTATPSARTGAGARSTALDGGPRRQSPCATRTGVTPSGAARHGRRDDVRDPHIPATAAFDPGYRHLGRRDGPAVAHLGVAPSWRPDTAPLAAGLAGPGGSPVPRGRGSRSRTAASW
jgi:hypothetical protein